MNEFEFNSSNACPLRSFNALIGDLNEIRSRDYGDKQRGAQRYVASC